ncbi:MAG: hypothetical protein U5K79_01655 [Cyclobacteriaceae bacterium]|nr:hypothetical protein [Cyclobacteriaceae bacterium]
MEYGFLRILGDEPVTGETTSRQNVLLKSLNKPIHAFLICKKQKRRQEKHRLKLSLERVRSRSLATHKPEELQEVVAVVAEKLKELGVIFDAGGVILCTYFPDNKDVMHWITVDDFSSSGSYLVPYFDNPIFNDAWIPKIKVMPFSQKNFQ